MSRLKTHATTTVLIGAALLTLSACAEPARFGPVHIGMPLGDFQSAFPGAEELDATTDPSGNEVRTMQVAGTGDQEKAYYYVIRGHVIGACVVLGKGVEYDQQIERISAQNGPADQREKTADAETTQWRRKGALINLMKTGPTKTKLELPNGKQEVLGPRRVVVLMQNG